ncbi:DEAD/DEAH box helicase family protein [Bacillus subtilis]|uniref:restriction endonuclease n=1 Tax=Bacillus subtilis TaxID=1423 RepID=UPI0002B4031C|nr:DEAD/DEAH box helicase family protein [Bacillus subtilis]AGE65627.1 type III restriction-modification system restriction subunit [Bacillus subtilis XF-1]MCL9627629.1 DEAD/DEAH box helicase family protein [Bacillus subtilis]UTI60181.1 DEAD/DEAH box helicase family protein [Bacillus subtilis]UXL15572.1 DEAD/DEAH box helicase family protein [Bacillus subtilis]
MKKLTLQYNPDQQFQLDAISSVVDLFEGVPYQEQVDLPVGTMNDVTPNFPADEFLDEIMLFENLQKVQEGNNDESRGSELEFSDDLYVDDGMVLEVAGNDSIRVPHFTVEMETGTGKTYVYIRTMYELKKNYGFTKFIVVVPSIAIYQGVIKSLKTMRSHFRQLYDNQDVAVIEYDSAKLGELNTFTNSSDLTVMVMTIDSFNKASNNIFKHTEKLQGEWKPYQYIQATRPIVILDEAQNFETNKAKEAIRTLKPLFVLRYSATHRETPNLVYRLTPIDAFRNNLVKQIEVIGISELGNLNEGILRLLEIKRNPMTAVLRALVLDKGQLVERDISLKQGDDLFVKTKNPDYEQFVVEDIRYGRNEEDQLVVFENGVTLSVSDSMLSKESIFRAQIERTISVHMQRQQTLKAQGIKVLSLFFIDRVKNYTAHDGMIKRLFDETFERLKRHYDDFKDLSANEVRQGYFSKPKADSPEEESVDTEGKNQKQREMEKQAFELIMKDKERLLSFSEPVSFVFAHSALKEGWDNPNVFQICTLNQTSSTMKKRQEIGRGLRLSVDQEGKRAENHDINILTVVANEQYESFVSRLQQEYIEDGVDAPPAPKPPEPSEVNRRDDIYKSEEFNKFWRKLNKKMSYKVSVDTDKLIQQCVERLNIAKFPSPLIEITKGRFIMCEYKISLVSVEGGSAKLKIEMEDSRGEKNHYEFVVEANDDLKKKTKDERLRGFKVLHMGELYGEPYVKFANEITVKKFEPFKFQTEKAEKPKKQVEQAEKSTYPIPDFITRTANETNLTKKTIVDIFKRINKEQTEKIFYNPEGWISTFLSEIRITLSDHIVDNIEFEIDDNTEVYELDTLFPEMVKQPQRELIEAGKAGLYDKIQVDSDVEREFIENLIKPDVEKDNTILYFKFPPKFKILLPKIIGNYNPDWAIVRRYNGKLKLELVRETKGGVKLEDLRFPQEKRKILCAMKYFEKIGVSYKVVTSTSHDWMQLNEAKQLSFKEN